MFSCLSKRQVLTPCEKLAEFELGKGKIAARRPGVLIALVVHSADFVDDVPKAT